MEEICYPVYQSPRYPEVSIIFECNVLSLEKGNICRTVFKQLLSIKQILWNSSPLTKAAKWRQEVRLTVLLFGFIAAFNM